MSGMDDKEKSVNTEKEVEKKVEAGSDEHQKSANDQQKKENENKKKDEAQSNNKKSANKSKRTFVKIADLESNQRVHLFLTILIYVVVSVLCLTHFVTTLSDERQHADDSWYTYLSDSPEQKENVAKWSQGATVVNVGTYVENIRELNYKSSYFRVEAMVWFDWEGDESINPMENFRVYKGVINKTHVYDEMHEGNKHYQLIGLDVSVSKSFDTKRFPLDSQQLRFYIECTQPINEVIFQPDYENSGMNANLELSGYEFVRSDIGQVTYTYDSTHGNPTMKEQETTSEVVTAMEINRSSFGLYFRCFIALAGTITWVLIALFICSYHHVDPLSMLPAALFGTVGNIMVGANLLPDALEMGLLEYVNLWGVVTIIGVTIVIININNIRKNQGNHSFANLYGTVMFYVVAFFAIIGQIILPLSSYIWN